MAKVLTVDDSVSLRKLVAATLTSAGHQVTEASTGIEGLSQAQIQKFDLVITDVNMPGMDGLTMVKQLRQVNNYRRVPILVLTTEVDVEKKRIAKEAGATGWLVKPFDPEQLLATIRKVLD